MPNRQISPMAQALSACLRLGLDARVNTDRYTKAQRGAALRLEQVARDQVTVLLAAEHLDESAPAIERAEALGVSRFGAEQIAGLLTPS